MCTKQVAFIFLLLTVLIKKIFWYQDTFVEILRNSYLSKNLPLQYIFYVPISVVYFISKKLLSSFMNHNFGRTLKFFLLDFTLANTLLQYTV